jgi:hypothetical protein
MRRPLGMWLLQPCLRTARAVSVSRSQTRRTSFRLYARDGDIFARSDHRPAPSR